MTDLHGEVPPHGRRTRSRQEYRSPDEPLLTHGGDLYAHGGQAPATGMSWSASPNQARRRDDPRTARRDQEARPEQRGVRWPQPARDDRGYPAQAQPRAGYPAGPRDADDRYSDWRQYPDDRRHPEPGRPADRYPDRHAQPYPDQYPGTGRAPAPVGYADEDPRHWYDPYRQGGPYDDDPYDDDPYGESPPGDGSGGRHRRSGDGGGGGRRWTFYAKRAAAVLGVLALLAGGFVVYEYKHLDANITRVKVLQTQDKNIRQAEKQKNAENFLLIGSDSRAGTDGQFGKDVEGARSDTTILAHLSPNHDRAILISIPRDSWVDIPSCVEPNGKTTVEQTGQFNSAFAIGGPNCTIRTVQKLTGIAVNHYVQVDFTGFQNMVHALGGITMCSSRPYFDSYSGLRLQRGDNVLDGAQALAYVRARHGLGNGGDLDRIARQQRFLGAMMRKATSGDVLLNPVKLQRFLNAATKSLTMDQNTHIGDLKDLATALHGLDPARVSFLTPFIANPAYDPNDPSNTKGGRVLLDEDKNRALFDSIINDETAQPTAAATSAAPAPTTPANQPKLTVAPEDIQVYVYNGVGTNHLGAQVKGALAVLGFTIVDVGNQGTGLATSEVHYGPGHIDQARTLAAAVPGSVLRLDPHYQHSVAVVVGANYSGVHQVKVGDPYAPVSGGSTSPAPNGPITPSGAINAADTTCAS